MAQMSEAERQRARQFAHDTTTRMLDALEQAGRQASIVALARMLEEDERIMRRYRQQGGTLDRVLAWHDRWQRLGIAPLFVRYDGGRFQVTTS